ncbi:MAG: hypothetical protein EOO56_14065 [Hymenobacter sp.]|nr:MAG: hypothetical protein EOO56_14065 [Hymenobacter sp.]
MRKLIALCALLLSASAAMAQTDKTPAVTKLPGEERLSIRERAERDFLMPTRHKKMAEVVKVTASTDQDATAAPELDATAHYAEAPEVRPEEVAAPEHHAVLRHHSRARSTRHHSAARVTAHTSKATRHAKAEKASAHRNTRKATAHKTKTKTKKVVAAKHHTAAKKATKAKTSSHKKRRR